jgi:hypothetical protein
MGLHRNRCLLVVLFAVVVRDVEIIHPNMRQTLVVREKTSTVHHD